MSTEYRDFSPYGVHGIRFKMPTRSPCRNGDTIDDQKYIRESNSRLHGGIASSLLL
jgi:hypothetical protein